MDWNAGSLRFGNLLHRLECAFEAGAAARGADPHCSAAVPTRCENEFEPSPNSTTTIQRPTSYRLGVFISGFRDAARDAAPICVRQGVVRTSARGRWFDPFLHSVLWKSPPTFSPQHTHIALRDNDFCLCRLFEFADRLG
jgi:hypothetical protein